MRPAKQFYVYIMTNRQRSHVLYTGVTGSLVRRVWEHKNKVIPGFTSRYNLTRLVYYERFVYPDAAISREKEIKGWRRGKKIKLIESTNPHWEDLAERWGDIYKPESRGEAREIPRPAGENAGLRDDASVELPTQGIWGSRKSKTLSQVAAGSLPAYNPAANKDS